MTLKTAVYQTTFQVTYFFLFFNPCPRSHDHSETFPLHTINVNKGKFTLEIRSLNGSHALLARCIDAKTVKCARLPLLSILSDKNHRSYQQLSIFARLMSISTGVKNKMLLDGENKREWGLEQRGVLVSGRFFCSCSLRSFFLASILK